MRLEELRSPFAEHEDENYMGVAEVYSEPASGEEEKRVAVVISIGNFGERKVYLFLEREASTVRWLRKVLKLVQDNDVIGITGRPNNSGIKEVIYNSDVSIRDKDEWIEAESPRLGKVFTTKNTDHGSIQESK